MSSMGRSSKRTGGEVSSAHAPALHFLVQLLASLDVVRNAANGAEGVRPLKLATRLLLACGRDGAAVRLLGAIEAWQLRYQFDPEGALWNRRWTLPGDEDVLGHAHVRLAEGELAAARADGSRLSLDEALAEAVDDVRNARSVLAADTPRVAQD